MKIGIFDSGYGGLSVLHSAFCKIDAEFIYYADEKHVPYGEKSRDEILCFVREIVEFLREKGVDAIIIACNRDGASGKISHRSIWRKFGIF